MKSKDIMGCLYSPGSKQPLKMSAAQWEETHQPTGKEVEDKK
jgi:hypothetical protein